MMPEAKHTPAVEPVTVFLPQRWRIALLESAPHLQIAVLTFVVVAAAGFLYTGVFKSGRISPVHYLQLAGAALITGLVAANKAKTDHSIEIGRTQITTFWNHRGAFRSRKGSFSMAFADIDRQRSSQRTALDRFWGRQRIYSHDGTFIVLRRRAFAPDDVRKILNMLNVRD